MHDLFAELGYDSSPEAFFAAITVIVIAPRVVIEVVAYTVTFVLLIVTSSVVLDGVIWVYTLTTFAKLMGDFRATAIACTFPTGIGICSI